MSDPRSESASHEFPPEARLRRGGDFDRVYARRTTMRNDAIRVFAAASETGRPRLGLSVSRKVGNAVARNRWKRLIRESFRLQRHKLPAVDLIVQPLVGEPPALDALKSELVRLARKLAGRLPPGDEAPRRDGATDMAKSRAANDRSQPGERASEGGAG